MSLPALTWKQLPNQIVAAGTTSPAAVLDAIGTAFASTTYITGAARVPGAGVAWTRTVSQVSGVTEAIYLSPATNTLGQRVVIGGSTTARTLSILSGTGQSSVANLMYVGIGKNVTTNAQSWYGPTASPTGVPFSDGNFSGYQVFGAARVANTTSLVRCYESQDAVVVTVEISGAVYMAAIIGAFVDPESANALDAESDGKLYGFSAVGTAASTLSTSGPSGTANWCAGNSNSASALLMASHLAGNAYGFSSVFTPGGSTMLNASILSGFGYPYTWSQMQTLDNINVRFPIMLCNGSTTAGAGFATFIGRVREIWYSGYALNGVAYENSGSLVGYLISANGGQSGQSLLLTV